MTETLILGSINGLTIGLLAVGLVLVYKANRFINLAHAQLGAVSAILLAKLVIDWGVSWYLAFLAAGVQLAYSYPDVTYAAPSKLYGGDTWSVLQYAKDCKCWHIISDQRRPSFAA